MYEYTAIIPMYNSQDTIEEALDSIIAQSIPPKQIIVVDDGSSDSSREIVKRISSKIHLIHQKNQGPGSATSAGIEIAKTEWIATLDADDIWIESKMSLQFDFIKNNPDSDIVFGHLQNFNEGKLPDKIYPGWTRSTMTMRKSVFDSLGAICDPNPYGGEMVDWFAKAREQKFKLEMLSEVLALRRIREGSLTHGLSDSLKKGYLQTMRKAILRKRQSEET